MKITKTPEYRDKICKGCGKSFTPKSGRSEICDECRNGNRIKQRNPGNDLMKFERMREKFNREHKTNYSYGKFVRILSGETSK